MTHKFLKAFGVLPNIHLILHVSRRWIKHRLNIQSLQNVLNSLFRSIHFLTANHNLNQIVNKLKFIQLMIPYRCVITHKQLAGLVI
jgi:hypothetical protein